MKSTTGFTTGCLFFSLCVFSCCLLFAVCSHTREANSIANITATIDLTKSIPIRNVSERYLSLTLDTALIKRHWGGIIWWKGIILAGALSPAYLRVGGTTADFLLFEGIRVNETSYNSSSFGEQQEDDLLEQMQLDAQFNVTMTEGDFDRLSSFARWSNLSVIFDLNSLLRTSTGEWDWRANADRLLRYAEKQRMQLHFQLGNEPDLYPRLINRSIPASQLSLDYGTLKSLLDREFPFYRKSLLIGPSVANLVNGQSGETYFAEFLKGGGAKSVDALSFHHYYFDSKKANKEQFLDPSIMDSLSGPITNAKRLFERYVPKPSRTELWMDETGSGYGGGAPGLSDTFISTFLWLDKLGLSALLGVDAVFRQSLFGSSYSLLDPFRSDSHLLDQFITQTSSRPYCITIIDRIRRRVYRNYTRFYAHCDKDRVTVFGMNLLNESLTLEIITSAADGRAADRVVSSIYSYILSSPSHDDLLQTSVLLNGEKLHFDGVRIPALNGTKVEGSKIVISPYSLGFFVLDQRISGC